MFRRNRPLRPAVAPARIGFEQDLRQAHALFNRGEYTQAALIFERWGGLAAARSGPLPLKYPSCGAAVLSAEIVWLDENTAECAYCGNPLRGE